MAGKRRPINITRRTKTQKEDLFPEDRWWGRNKWKVVGLGLILFMVLVVWDLVYKLGIFHMLMFPAFHGLFGPPDSFLWDSVRDPVTGHVIFERTVLGSWNPANWEVMRTACNDDYLSAIGTTLFRAVTGYVIAISSMTLLGILMGYWRSVYNLFEPIVELLRPLPPPAIIPVTILFLGVEDPQKIFFVFIGCAFPVLVNTIDGVRNVDPLLINTAKTFRLSRWEIFRKMILPAASPFIVSGMRVALPLSLVLAVFAEFMVSKSGIGSLLIYASSCYRPDWVFGGVVLLAIVGYIFNKTFLFLIGKWMAWHKGAMAAEI